MTVTDLIDRHPWPAAVVIVVGLLAGSLLLAAILGIKITWKREREK